MEYLLARLRTLAASIRRYRGRTALVVPVLLLVYVLLLIPFTPGIGDLRRAKAATPSVAMSVDGVVLAQFQRLNREWVPLEKIAPSVIDALIATEDVRFYEHHGIDFRRTAGALVATVKGDRQGGSTITQQLARNLYPEEIGRAANIHRKIKEAIVALKIEALYTKREILETYLNTVPFLFNAYGIEMAGRTYFDKNADELDVLEAATLVAMLKGPSSFNPVLKPERARTRRNVVLAQMAKHGKITQAQLATLSKRPLRLDFEQQSEASGPAPHIVLHIRKWLLEWADRNDYDIYSEGLVVRTTLDSRLQDAANQAIARQMKRLQPLADAVRKRDRADSTLQAGFMAMDPRDGAVRAWVGSRDFEKEQFDHVWQARRQPGSAFKPFVYGAALAMGIPSTTTFMDQAVTIRVPGGSEIWQPRDVSPPSNTPMTLRQGLAYSKNTITAQLMEKVGPARVVQLAQSLGVRASKLEPVLSLALGTSPVTLREMVAAYSAIASGGQYIEPMLITRVEDRSGRVLVQFESKRESADALPRQHALELVDMMRGVIDQGTGAAIRSRYGITADVAGKTGTTQENTDGWFILMHPHLVAGARVGFNSTLTMGNWGQGARSALPIVGEVFQQALRVKAIDGSTEFDVPRKRAEAPAPQPELLGEPLPEGGELGGPLPGEPPVQNDLMPRVQGLPPPQSQQEAQPQSRDLPPAKGLVLPPPRPDPQPQSPPLPPAKGLILPPPQPDPQPQPPRPVEPPPPAPAGVTTGGTGEPQGLAR